MRLVRLLFALLILVTLVCCGPSSRPPEGPPVDLTGWPHGPVVHLPGGHTITCPNSVSSSDTVSIARITSAITFYIANWEADESTVVPPTNFGIVDGECECNQMGNDYAGCWRGSGAIVSTSGQGLNCYPIYHELCHRVYQLYGHTDQRWTKWNDRMTELSQEFLHSQ